MKKIDKNIKKIKNKKVFLRVDMNVPLQKGKILDEKKIIAALPTIRFLLRYDCQVIIGTHLGRPKGKQKKLSTEVIAKRLKKILGGNRVGFAGGLNEKKVVKKAEDLRSGQILFLENLRFDPGEEKNNLQFAKNLAQMADIHVNEAFSVSHRKHASVCAIKRYLPSFAGLLLIKELNNLDRIKKPKKPLVIVMGGAKVETKIKLIDNLKPKASKIMIGGALANNFLKARKYEVGKSLTDKKSIKIAKKMKSEKIILPVDAVVKSGRKITSKKIDEIGKNDKILDIGPQTVKNFSDHIKKANTIAWNGPLGMFEEKDFRHGTLSIAHKVAGRAKGPAFGIAGGGETIQALSMAKVVDHMDWVSTGGGAMLTYLGGEEMPGL